MGSNLTEITGIGTKTAKSLSNSGVDSIEELADADPDELDAVSSTKAQKIIRRARQQTITSTTATDLLDDYENQEYVSTGIDALDEALDGGWEAETVGLVYGKSDTGKTQVIFRSLGSAASEGPVVYVMTEIQSKSIANRMRSLANSVNDLDNIHIFEAHGVDEQYEIYELADQQFDDIQLFVVDSFTAQFRIDEQFQGRNNLGERSQVMGRHLRRLGEIGRVHECPIVLTGQTYPTPEAFGRGDNPWGGEKFKHFVSYYLRMSEAEGILKRATVENHPSIPETDVSLNIEGDGITGVDV